MLSLFLNYIPQRSIQAKKKETFTKHCPATVGSTVTGFTGSTATVVSAASTIPTASGSGVTSLEAESTD